MTITTLYRKFISSPPGALIGRLAVLFVFYFVLRALFLLIHSGKLGGASAWEILETFRIGFLFDASAIFSISVLFILFSLLPLPFRGERLHGAYQGFLRILYFLPNLLFIFLATVDLEFFKFTDRRMTIEIMNLREEAGEQLGQLIFHYWHTALLCLLSAGALWFVYPRLPPGQIRYSRWWHGLIALPVGVLLTVLAIRGSLGVRPLAPGHAFLFSSPAAGNLALNTPFVFIKSIQGQLDGGTVPLLSYYASDDDAAAIVTRRSPLDPKSPSSRFDNVVLIIAESLSSEYFGYETGGDSYTPFLDSLARRGVAFTNHFANSRRSITALPAILAAIPDWLPTSFSTSLYQSNKLFGLGHGLRKHGFETTFFHGTRNGTMTFDYMSRVAGFENYYALNEYGPYDPADHDGAWGIFDEPMLQRVASLLSDDKRPFGAVVFTLTSHQPFNIPEKYKGKLKSGPTDVHETISYVDYAIQKFFETAKTKDWYHRTLFVITGDHTSYHPVHPEYANPLGTYDVPLLFFHPSRKIAAPDPARIAQQTDIPPSILDALGIHDGPGFPFGRSLFSKNEEGIALLRVSDQFTLVRGDYFLTYAGGNGSRLYRFLPKKIDMTPIQDQEEVRVKYERLIQAYLQFFNNGLIANRWF